MSVPVHTWGSLVNFTSEQKAFAAESSEFLESKEVYDLFGHLLRQVIINQPENPIAFLQDQLRHKPQLRICVVGPPGVNRSKYCQQIEQEFRVKHIHVGRLLRQKKELKDQIESGSLVADSIVVAAVKAEIAKASKTGWVLDGFPRTKVQAQALALKDNGFCMDKVILLHSGEKTIRQRFIAKAVAAGFNPEEREDFINHRLEQYQRHIISVAEFYKNIVRQVEASGDESAFELVMDVIRSSLHVRLHSNAPFRSHRICVLGAPGSGKTTQSRAISRNYGLVHVDVAVLVRKFQAEKGVLVEGGTPPEWMSDEELCEIVGKRLNNVDCLRKGWVLDGFPKTAAQAEFLRLNHHWPSRVASLAVSEETVLARTADRKIDPVTGAPYYRPPQNPVVAGRLMTADFDEPAKIKERYALHDENVRGVLQAFPTVRFGIEADGAISELTSAIYEKINEALPSELAQDAATAES
mmetsp:Transcript_37688/g.107120  ORF Transcript_37688/g.107120 Transcript_37688/m.107120 type:complete len:468 (+) Transcript_37688:88-1491(+)